MLAVITLFQPPPIFGLPCLSPFGTKVETYLRMVELPYQTAPGDPRKGPKGKIPYIADNGRIVSDSSDILDYLKATYGDRLDKQLTPAQRAVGHAARRMAEEHLYWCAAYVRWVEPEGFKHLQEYFKKFLPPVIGGVVLKGVLRKGAIQKLDAQGLGRHSREDIYRRACEDIDALAVLLGDQTYFLGPEPTSVDATIFALTSGIWMFPTDNPAKRCLSGHANLVQYTERMNARYFGAHPPGKSKDAA